MIEVNKMSEAIKSFNWKEGGYIHFHNTEDFMGLLFDDMRELLRPLIGEKVSVDVRTKTAMQDQDSFENSIRVTGTLEYNEYSRQYRIVVAVETYCYFQLTNIREFGYRGNGKTFSDGVFAVIGLKF